MSKLPLKRQKPVTDSVVCGKGLINDGKSGYIELPKRTMGIDLSQTFLVGTNLPSVPFLYKSYR